MIVIPQNLPQQVAPLTWLLGTWSGWGTTSGLEQRFATTPNHASADKNSKADAGAHSKAGADAANESGATTGSAQGADRLITFELDAQVVDSLVRSRLTVFDTDAVVELDTQTSALEGVELLPRVGVAWEEVAYWSVLAGGKNEDEKYLQLTSATTMGLAQLWVGKVQGPRIRLLLDTLARTESARSVSKGERMLGLVNSDIFFTQTLTTDQGETTTSGRLARIEDPEPIPAYPPT